MNGSATARAWVLLPWIALLIFPLIEVAAHAVTRASVATRDDWRAAAAFVRDQSAEGDLFVAAPEWADPMLRWALGDRIDAAMAGRTGLAGYRRMWAFSLRGARPAEVADQHPELARDFGAVRVERFALSAPPVRYDLVEHVFEASVTQDGKAGPRPCVLGEHGAGRRSGLGVGVAPPDRRFQCPDRRGFVWVAPVVMEDLELRPRRCVFQHPAGRAPVRVTLPEVPLDRELELHAGLYYEHERMRQGAPVELTVRIDGARVGRMVHRDGDGWSRLAIDTAARAGQRAQVSIETTTDNPRTRIFCWAARVLGEGAAR